MLEINAWQSPHRLLTGTLTADACVPTAMYNILCLAQANSTSVRKAAQSPQASVRQRAAALLRLLGGDAAEDAPAAAAPRAHAGAPVADLIGGMDEPADVATAAPATSDDLLGIDIDWVLPLLHPSCGAL